MLSLSSLKINLYNALMGGASGSALSLDFLSGALDSRITFTRGTNATLVDSTGKITYAPANLLLQSNAFTTGFWVRTDASLTTGIGDPAGGTSATTLTATAAFGVIQQAATSTAGTYSASIWIKRRTGTGQVSLRCGDVTPIPITVTSSWVRYTVTAVASSTTIRLAVILSISGDEVDIYGAQLEPVTYQTTAGPYVATTSAAYYGPRFDYDPVTLAPKGLLIEEARTNLLTYSEQFDNALWVKINASVTANAAVSPDGTATADKLIADASNAQHRVQFGTTSAAATYAFSVYLKAAGYNFGIVRIGTSGGWVNLTNGAISTVTGGYTMTSTSVGNGWYRVVLVGAAVLNDTVRINVSNADAATDFLGDGVSGIFLYGAQLEAGSFATSYIPTVASTVTRSADVATMTGTNFSSWYNQSAGTFVAAFDMAGGSAAFSNNRAIFVAREGATSGHNIYNGSGQVTGWTVVSGVDQAFLTTGAFAADTVTNMAYAYRANDFAASRNGGTVATDTSGTLPAPTVLGIGSNSANSLFLSGHIRQLAYFNTRLPDAQLQTLTEPDATLSLNFISSVYEV